MGKLEIEFMRKVIRLAKGILSAFGEYVDQKETALREDLDK